MDWLPPLNPLRAFEAAGRFGSVRRAAEELGVTPGAVSRQVQVLENELGVQLFRRSPSAMALTVQGEQYLAAISPHLDGIREASRRLTGRRGPEVLKVRAYTTFAMKWLIPRLSVYQQTNRVTDVRLTTSLENVDFSREDVDCAIRLGDGNWPGLEADRLVRNELIPVCTEALCREVGLRSPQDLQRVSLLHSLARPDDWRYWLEAAGLQGIDPYAGPRYASSVLALQAVMAGQGVMLAQKALMADDLRDGRLVQPFGPALDRGSFTYYLVYPAGRLRNPSFRRFRAWLIDQAE
ncbi:transcriptional regulator GcvA [Roseomonas sp. KE2513]|uniref:transcriptional regulator GcvA n=1 Tax=Roseomonas sp. KE2513 TaxID=2479202 RepID=UPI0018DFE663|nr:transcriptional regulator GcvA [Roseomonas sp. KE2513]MBI0539544.1 transcriptional regulator GcvA [Roseomonas sp. KE2513]